MGLEFTIVASERKVLDKVVCDGCGAEIKKISEGGWNSWGESYSVYHEPGFEDFFTFHQYWGYHSSKDGEHHEAVLCEPCYDRVFQSIKLHITDHQ